MLDVTGLNKTYEGSGRTVEALRDLTFTIADGDLVCLVGPSGCGKTTLLKCIAGLMSPTRGTVELAGRSVTSPPDDMAVVFQEYGRSLFPWLRVRDNVDLPLRHRKLSKAERAARVDEALAAVGLADAHSAYPWQLSGGMQQRVAIARAIASKPKILLMDEPFAAVDAQTRAELEDLIRDLWHEFGVTILFVTHDIDEAVYLGQRVLMLSSSPTVVREDLAIDLPDARDQLTTRSSPRFAELRARVYAQIQHAKNPTGIPDAAPSAAQGPESSGPGSSGAGAPGAGPSGSLGAGPTGVPDAAPAAPVAAGPRRIR